MDWSFPPDIQAQYDRVVADIQRLQAEFGIAPRTMEQRYQDYLKKQSEQAQLTAQMGNRRPPPKWKV
jgi:hypothetical protein